MEGSKEAVRRTIDAQINSLENSIIRLKQRRNDLAPISVLPVEMLSKIFRISVGEPKPAARLSATLIAITSVCVHWRAVTVRESSLWSTISSLMSSECREMLVARSKEAPISVIISTELNQAPSSDATLAQMCTLLEQTSRLESVSIKSSTLTATHLLALLMSPAPFVRNLNVHIDHDWHPDEISDEGLVLGNRLFDEKAPLLRRLNFTNCSLPWTSSLYRGVSSITIIFNGREPSFTPRELYQGLKVVAPRLQELSLRFPLRFDESIATDGPVALPQLASLSLGRTSEDTINLLPFLYLDTSASLTLRCDWTYTRAIEALCTALSTAWLSAPLSGTSSSGPLNLEKLSVINNAGDLRIKGWKKEADGQSRDQILSIIADEDIHGENIGLILRHLPLHNLCFLELRCHFASASDIEEILSRTPLLQSITVSEYIIKFDVDAFLAFLVNDHLEQSDEASVMPPKHRAITRLPCLQEIVFADVTDRQGLASFLQRLSLPLRERARRGNRLDRIILNVSIDKDVVQQLKDGTGLKDVIFMF
ncbi:hypothetical protein BKA70DRAFT_1256623 [Coprinopsis sp. MPI-PUGE-AT-0042]|nr:hypothetical protein BKA70DRAFT_1256623 [Coprinopsis sp. MPI-PUGE-AT-0042]